MAAHFRCEYCDKTSEFQELPELCPHCKKPLTGTISEGGSWLRVMTKEDIEEMEKSPRLFY